MPDTVPSDVSCESLSWRFELDLFFEDKSVARTLSSTEELAASWFKTGGGDNTTITSDANSNVATTADMSTKFLRFLT